MRMVTARWSQSDDLGFILILGLSTIYMLDCSICISGFRIPTWRPWKVTLIWLMTLSPRIASTVATWGEYVNKKYCMWRLRNIRSTIEQQRLNLLWYMNSLGRGSLEDSTPSLRTMNSWAYFLKKRVFLGKAVAHVRLTFKCHWGHVGTFSFLGISGSQLSLRQGNFIIRWLALGFQITIPLESKKKKNVKNNKSKINYRPK